MGKGEIISDLGDGEYSLRIIYAGRSENEAKILAYNNKITELQTQYDSMPEDTVDEVWAKRIVGLQITALEKKVEYYENNFPADPTINAWCADLTESLSGEVGTIEIPGEFSSQANIVPGDSGEAAWDGERDGQLTPVIGGTPWGVFLNKCLLPGWQKWKPLHRYGTIVADSLNFGENTCSVCLDPAYSSQQNLDVNQNQDFSGCETLSPAGFEQFCINNPAHPT